MKQMMMALAATAFLAGSAFAATVQGVVTDYNMDTRVVSLDSGQTYTIPTGIPIPPELKVGDHVTLITDETSLREVKSVTLSPMQ